MATVKTSTGRERRRIAPRKASNAVLNKPPMTIEDFANDLGNVTSKLDAISSMFMNHWPPDAKTLEALVAIEDDLVDRLKQITNEASVAAGHVPVFDDVLGV